MTTKISLQGKVALITGAAGSIGRTTARLLAERGAVIVAVDMAGTDFETLKNLLPGETKLRILKADVTEEHSVEAYVSETRDEFGKIDFFFNNAGIEGPVKPISEYPLDSFRKVIDINVIGVFLGLKHVLPVMYAQNSGSIVNSSSIAGLTGSAGLSAYNASKHAVIGLTRSAAVEAAARGVRVNAVNPGPIEGRMMASITAGRGDERAAHEAIVARIPQHRFGRPEEVAEMVAFLASDAASYCNGSIYSIDGGLNAV